MTVQAPNWFTTQYAKRAMDIYQSRGNKLRGMVTPAGEIVGAEKVRFFLAGKSVAVKRQRNQRLVPSGAERKYFEAALIDWAVLDTCDTYDLDRMPIDERENVYSSGAMALGRGTDNEIYLQMATAQTTANSYRGATLDFSAGAFSAANALTVCGALQDDKIPWDGNVFCGLPSLQWNQLLANKVVNSADHVDRADLPFMKATDSRFWNGVNWFLAVEENPLDWFPVPAGNKQDLFAWHQGAMGWGNHTDLRVIATWDPYELCWVITSETKGLATPLQQGNGIKRFTTSTNSAIAIV